MYGSEEKTFLLFLLILYYGIRLFFTDRNSHPLVANLFNMTILLFFFELLFPQK